MGKEGEHEVQQRKLHLVMAFTKKSKKKANDDDEDDHEDSEKGSEGGGHTKAARKQRITRQIRRGSELDGVMTHLKTAAVLDVMSDDDLNLLCNRGFTLHEFAPGAPVTTVGDEREETRVMYVVVGGSVEETRV